MRIPLQVYLDKPLEWWNTLQPAAQVTLYLEFSNAVVFVLMTACVLIFLENVMARARSGDSRVFGELSAAVLVVFLAFAWRAYLVWEWRNGGALYSDFPRLGFFLIDLFILIPGCALVMRAGARRGPVNWPWIVAVTVAVSFGIYSVLT